jgi:uncharacterized membrane protein HdeD (DUF308 family)
MNKQEEQLDALNDIRKMMDRSARFISLSGLSGVFAGFAALIGAHFANMKLTEFREAKVSSLHSDISLEITLLKIGMIVLFSALAGGVLFTYRKSRSKGLPIWDKAAKNLLVNLALPLIAGGIFIISLLLVHSDSYELIAPSCLIFYGLALINASKYTYSDIRFLGCCEIILGLLALFNTVYSLHLWAAGFGVLHIIYGLVMYFKYERSK